MTTSEIIALCALGVSALMMLLSMRKGTQKDAAAQARNEAKLDSLVSGVADIRIDLRSLKNDTAMHTAKLAELEARQMDDHWRIEEIFDLYRKAHPPDGKRE